MSRGGLTPGELALRSAYFTLLQGAYSDNGYPVPVYDNVFDQLRFPYIVLGSHETANTSGGSSLGSKLDYIQDISLSVFVYSGRADQYGSKKLAHEIGIKITQLVTQGNGKNLNLGPDHYLLMAVQVGNQAATEAWQTGRVQMYEMEFLNKVDVQGTYQG
jgi:hypothetical protein